MLYDMQGRAHRKLTQEEVIGRPIAREQLVTALPIEQHRNTMFTCQAHDTPCCILTHRARRLIMMIDKRVEILQECFGGRESVKRLAAILVENDLDVRTLIKGGLMKGGRKRIS